MCSNVSLKSLSQLKTKFTWDHHGIRVKIYSNDSGQLLLFILILSAPGGGAFSGDFTTNLARQCRAFSRALKIEKLKAPLFRGPEGAGATNNWCITPSMSCMFVAEKTMSYHLRTVTLRRFSAISFTYTRSGPNTDP